MIKLLICDLDGTLLNTLEDLADSMNDTLAAFGFPTHPLDAYPNMIGDGAQMLAARAVPIAWQHDTTTIDCVYQAYLATYSRRWDLKTHLYTGIAPLLDTCVAHGIKLAVFSNKTDIFTQQTVHHFLGKWPWSEIRGQRPNIPRKPAPDGALAIASALEISPETCAFLGDSGVDMACAHTAGMIGIGAQWGFRPDDELTANGARHLAFSPDHVWDFLGS